MSSQVPSSAEDLIIEEREEFMVSPSYTGGLASKRIAHFLKPTVASPADSSLKLPLLSPKSKWPLNLVFSGWQGPLKMWEKWVDQMFLKYHSIWRKAGILEAVLSSRYQFNRNDELIFGVAERWCADTNTFVFPWGEASITLEDVMILGGFSVLGGPVLLPLVEKDLVDIETNLKKELKKLEKVKSYTHIQWIDLFMRHGSQHEHEAFLASWLSRFVFPVDEITKIGKNILPIAIHLARGTKIALAPAVLASLYRDLSLLKEIMTASTKLEVEEGEGNILALALLAPLHLVQLWAWERLVPFRPEPNSLRPGEPRAARWQDLQRVEIGNVRPIIDSSGEAFLWRPYCFTIDNWFFPKYYKEREEWVRIGQYSDEELESFARCLRVCVLIGIDCEEVYQPHRVAMQFGYDQDLPGLVSRPNLSTEIVWINYSKPLSNGESLYFPSRLSKPDVSIRYLHWWRKTVLAPVNSVSVQRGRRSFRIARRYFQVPKQTRVPDADFDAPMEENIEVPTVSAQVSIKQKIKVEEEDNFPDVPPGFCPKFKDAIDQNDLQNSPLGRLSARPETSTRRITDLNLPADTSPEAQVSNKQQFGVEEEEDNYPDVPPSFSPKFEEAIDQNDLPNSPPGHQSARPETSTKRIIDLNLPPDTSPECLSARLETHENGRDSSTHDDQSEDRNGLIGFNSRAIADLRARIRMVENSELGMPKRVKTAPVEH